MLSLFWYLIVRNAYCWATHSRFLCRRFRASKAPFFGRRRRRLSSRLDSPVTFKFFTPFSTWKRFNGSLKSLSLVGYALRWFPTISFIRSFILKFLESFLLRILCQFFWILPRYEFTTAIHLGAPQTRVIWLLQSAIKPILPWIRHISCNNRVFSCQM